LLTRYRRVSQPSDEGVEQSVAADEAGASDGASQLNAVFGGHS
jgi:hypothetical protein